VYTKEKSLQLIAEADRLQQLDREKKQSGQRVKPVQEQIDALRSKYGPANWQRTRELEQQEQQLKQRAAEQASSQSTGAQPASNDVQTPPDSGRAELTEVERWELEHEEADREMEEQEEQEAKLQEAEERATSEHRAADE
jgi:hypothetical protein